MIVAQLLVALTLQTTPQTFVQSFYDWYTRKGSNMDSVVEQRPSVLAPHLLAALHADREEQAKNAGEITGLDCDPFVNSQDPCEHYVAGMPVASGQHVRVPRDAFWCLPYWPTPRATFLQPLTSDFLALH